MALGINWHVARLIEPIEVKGFNKMKSYVVWQASVNSHIGETLWSSSKPIVIGIDYESSESFICNSPEGKIRFLTLNPPQSKFFLDRMPKG